MAQYGDQQGYGHEGRRTHDEYGNPIPVHHTPTDDQYGIGGGAAHHQAAGIHGAGFDPVHAGATAPTHRRSGSSSSSSSEDDGQGGRRKKGLKEKIKEKLPGGRKEGQPHEYDGGAATAPGGQGAAYPEHEKKGMMEKIKEKLPGHHN